MSILLSALFAGLVAVGVTVAIERWGGIVGGVLGTLPSTIVPASIGIHAASADGEAFAAAMASAPASMFLNVLFLYLWRVLPPHLPGQTLGRKLALMSGLGLGLWTCGAVATVVVVEDWRSGGGDPRLMGLVLTGMIGLVGLAATWQSHPAPAGRRSVGAAVLVLRGLLAAVAIAVSVWLAARGGAIAAGVASCFPAIFFTTMVSLWVSQGHAVPAGAAGPMMLGSVSVAVYALLVTLWVPTMGVFYGCGISWVVAALGASLPAVWWLRRRSGVVSLE